RARPCAVQPPRPRGGEPAVAGAGRREPIATARPHGGPRLSMLVDRAARAPRRRPADAGRAAAGWHGAVQPVAAGRDPGPRDEGAPARLTTAACPRRDDGVDVTSELAISDGPSLCDVPACELCGETDTAFVLAAKDRYTGLPGEFGLVRCTGCSLVRLSP